MFLTVKGIGKIQDSTIEMKGITVITGENNSGKSTFGKVLYCMFNAFCNIDRKVLDERKEGIRRIITRDFIFDDFDTIQLSDQLMEKILNLKDAFSAEKFREIMVNSYEKITESDINTVDNVISKYIDEIERYVNFDDTEIKEVIISRFFRSEFMNQINHVNHPEDPGAVKLIINGKEVQIEIFRNECVKYTDNVGIIHNAILIDTPFVLDDVGNNTLSIIRNIPKNNHRNNLLYKIVKKIESSAITEAIVKQKLNNILEIIEPIINGAFIRAENSLAFKDNLIKQPFALKNISNGMKIFLIIKRLLEQNEIKEKEVLIFDEPEIHLHPQWQIKFAEILILLQKEFNLTILLTTHSPYFLHAIEVFSKKYDSINECNFYLAQSAGDTSNIYDVTSNIDEVYQQMALPFEKLDDITYMDNE
jgi:predicted ATP-dependent endonuclease of OLD family